MSRYYVLARYESGNRTDIHVIKEALHTEQEAFDFINKQDDNILSMTITIDGRFGDVATVTKTCLSRAGEDYVVEYGIFEMSRPKALKVSVDPYTGEVSI